MILLTRTSIRLTRTTTSTTTNDSDLGRVTTKRTNVPLDPIKGRSLVQQTRISLSILTHFGARKEPIGTETILGGNVDHRTVRSVDHPLIRIPISAPLRVSTSMYHDKNRKGSRLRFLRHVDVQE